MRLARQLVVPADRRRADRRRAVPVRLPGSRRGAPADLQERGLERVDRTAGVRCRARPELRLVARQAQQPPRRPQPGRPGPRHLVRAAGDDAGAGRPAHRAGPVVHPPAGLAAVPAAHPRGAEPARGRRCGTLFSSRDPHRAPGAVVDRAPPRRPGGVAGAPAPPGQGGGVPRRAGGRLRVPPRWVVHPQPHRDADRPAGRPDRLPQPAGADVAQHPRERARRRGHGRPELPDRAPPLPQHAPPPPEAGPPRRA